MKIGGIGISKIRTCNAPPPKAKVSPEEKPHMEWVMLLIGAATGAILGVAADRLVRRYIEVPTVRVDSSVLYSHESGQSFNLEVTNVGSVSLPPYEVVLHNPTCGSLRCFRKTEGSERLPGQREAFSFSLSCITTQTPEQHIQMLLRMLTTSAVSRREMSAEEFKLWRLQLILTHSDRVVLFDHAASGAAVAEIIREIVLSRRVRPTAEQMQRVNAHNSWTIQGRRRVSAIIRKTSAWWRQVASDPRMRRPMDAVRSWYADERHG